MKRITSPFKICFSTLSISLIAFTVQAEMPNSATNTFNHDIGVSYIHDTDGDNDMVLANYRYYFSDVNADKGPYALNTFLAQSSNVGVNYVKSDLLENTQYHLDGTYVFDSKWLLGVNYQQNNDDSDSYVYPYDTSQYGIKLGYYFNDSSEISFFYQNNSGSDSYSAAGNSSSNQLLQASFDQQADIFGLQTQSFIPMASFTGINLIAQWQYIDQTAEYLSTLSANQVDPIRSYSNESEKTYNNVYLSADFYINASWSIGAEYIWQDIDIKQVNKGSTYPDDITVHISDSINNYGLNTAYWWQITPHFSAKFSASKLFNDNDDNLDSLLLGLDLNARF